MKSNKLGIRASIWLYFLAFSVSILLILGILLIVFIKPYYRNDRLETVDMISDTIQKLILDDNSSKNDIDKVAQTVMGNNVCALIFNEEGKNIYQPPDSLGQLCMLDKPIKVGDLSFNVSRQPSEMIALIKGSSPFSAIVDSNYNGIEMLLYGKKIEANLVNYYLVLNTPLEPIDSYIEFILNQYYVLALIVVLIGIVISFFLSKKIASPIVKMKNEANRLAQGDYDVSFKTNSFSEIDDLANTLDDATYKLSQVNDLRKDLIANISHDIKTPLTMIKAYSEMIRDLSGDDPMARNEHLEVILKEVDYLDKLVSDMSQLSKLQAGIITANKENFELKECILHVCELLENLIEQKHIRLELDLQPCTVYADEVKISQVIYNFLTNAIKHSHEYSVIEINMKISEERVRVEVKDHGDGISETALPYIWDRYYKVDKNFNRSVASSGLGLAIAKAILEAHKAKYGVDSKEGEGSSFYFELSKDYDDV